MTTDVADGPVVLARLSRALSDPNRLRILVALSESSAYPSDLARALDLSLAAMAEHVRILRQCGLVEPVPGGVGSFVRLADLHLVTAIEELRRSAVCTPSPRDLAPDDRSARNGDGTVVLAGSCG